MTLLFQLIIGHAVADYALQSDWMAKAKNRHHRTVPPPGATYQACWFWVLSAHALIHGGAVYLITGSAWFGLLETLIHWCIDFAKCENWFGINTDQLLHLATKVMIVGLLYLLHPSP